MKTTNQPPLVLTVCLLVTSVSLGSRGAQSALERPCIWVCPADRAGILAKIEQQPWAKAYYDGLIERLRDPIEKHRADPDAYLRGMPFDWEKEKPGQTPPFTYTRHIVTGSEGVVAHPNLDNATRGEMADARKLIRYLQTAVDCGVAYYLTEEESYAQCATDILNAFIKGVIQMELSPWQGRGGWLFPDDGFREVRDIGQDVPMIYDFAASFIRKGGRPYDLGAKAKIEFPQLEAQRVFRTYADLTVHYGHTGSNHSVLAAPNLVQNALAFEDETQRNQYLRYYLSESTEHQDALDRIAALYKNEGDIWPETSQYSNAVSEITTRLMFILTKFDPSFHLGQRYPNIPLALPKWRTMKYPNGEIVRFGDGHRHGGISLSACEIAYALGKLDGVKKLTDQFGPLLNTAIAEGRYERGGLFTLLWGCENIEGENKTLTPARTDTMSHVGLYLQRNLSPTGNLDDGLMCFVEGGHCVHGHAEGMNIELYGKGQVLGVDNGRGSYAVDIHENYSRLFAAHNTVIVNGYSRSEGGWVNLGINTVQLVIMEPLPTKEAVSPLYSFSRTSFVDDKGDGAEAVQERTLSLVRTSDTTGYYIDIFRSKSKLPNEYHDYLYHNIGDKLSFLNTDMPLHADAMRYQANAQGEWRQNSIFRHPGWHFFEAVESSDVYDSDVQAIFSMEKLGDRPCTMKLFIPGGEGREYTKVLAPATFEVPAAYKGKPTPTLVMRQTGAAWDTPFVVVYEPYADAPNAGSVRSVEKITQDGIFKGLTIVSTIGGKTIRQVVISQSSHTTFDDPALGLHFRGGFAIVTVDGDGHLQDLYLGDGEVLSFKGTTVEKVLGDQFAAYLGLAGPKPEVSTNGKVLVTMANGEKLSVE